ncbi:hypothetical protein BKA65DRAFT_482478 [Rhexocercosporidium sp. MPI-PUGE-AT-0058]|nr:hypothetical protein BKA65DRAFT_482478 [Rhexocercosporidium sp. MPI-PUGE-AT-0058]
MARGLYTMLGLISLRMEDHTSADGDNALVLGPADEELLESTFPGYPPAEHFCGHGQEAKEFVETFVLDSTVRDAYCATLLGRPFRLNNAQCDTEYLTLEDFDHAEGCDGQSHDKCHLYAHYQIQISKLSLILRTIVEKRFGRGQNSPSAADLHTTLEWWLSELPSPVNWCQQGAPTDIFVVSLKIIFHLHLILIHLEKPSEVSLEALGTSIASSRIAESAAQMISSTAFTVITNSMLGQMPHEIFSGFFVAVIVFYRGTRQPDNMVAHLSGPRWIIARWSLARQGSDGNLHSG